MSSTGMSPEELQEWEAVKPLIEARGEIPETLMRKFIPRLADTSNRALIKAERQAEAIGDTVWREELRALRFAWEKGFSAYVERIIHDLDSDSGSEITPHYAAAHAASKTGSDGEIANKITLMTGRKKPLTRQAVQQWREKNPHLVLPPKKK